MANFNRVILAGNLTRDPDMRYTPKGTAICAIGIAINRTWKDESGEQKEEVTFVNCTAFGRTGEVIGQYLKKGRPILVEGRLKLDQWEDKQSGQKRQALNVVVESFQFMDSGDGGGDGGGESEPEPERGGGRQPTPTARERQRQAAREDAPPSEPEEDDVPF